MVVVVAACVFVGNRLMASISMRWQRLALFGGGIRSSGGLSSVTMVMVQAAGREGARANVWVEEEVGMGLLAIAGKEVAVVVMVTGKAAVVEALVAVAEVVARAVAVAAAVATAAIAALTASVPAPTTLSTPRIAGRQACYRWARTVRSGSARNVRN
jgi:hypothetical protein